LTPLDPPLVAYGVDIRGHLVYKPQEVTRFGDLRRGFDLTLLFRCVRPP